MRVKGLTLGSCYADLRIGPLPWLVGRDFNEILRGEEKLGGVERQRSLIEYFREILVECDLSDLGFSGADFTWCNDRSGSEFIQARLDRLVSTLEWRLLFPNSVVTHLEFWGSDHRPILLDCGSNILLQGLGSRGQRHRFHFEDCWLDSSDCGDIIQQNWGTHGQHTSISDISGSILKCAASLHTLNVMVSSTSWVAIKAIEKELDVLLYKEETYWRQRYRNNWLREGDKNTRFFHLSASKRKARNNIKGLLNSSDVWVSSKSEITGAIYDYFSPLFSSSIPSSSELVSVLRCVQPKVSVAINASLDAPFSRNDIKTAVFQMSPFKARGKDGMSVRFFSIILGYCWRRGYKCLFEFLELG
ncbi:hypothetical protein ACOSQ3_029276 [Xanthoceras sorbifolium]